MSDVPPEVLDLEILRICSKDYIYINLSLNTKVSSWHTFWVQCRFFSGSKASFRKTLLQPVINLSNTLLLTFRPKWFNKTC